jgi:putative ABC transport system permease protein
VFTESLFLGGLGGAAGLAIAWLMLRGFTPFLPADLTGAGREPGIDSTVLCFALLVTFAASLLFGAAPAFLYARDSVRGALTSGRSGAMADPARLRQVLAAGQVGLAATLLIGALLMLASFTRMMRVDLGFRQDPLLLARFNPRPAKMTSAEAGLAYYDRILAEIRGLPGVAAAGIASEIPLGPETTELAALPAEQAARIQTEGVQTQWRIVTDGFLETMGIPLLRGRMWTASERGRPLPVLISDSLRRRFWPAGEDPLGRTIRLGNGQSYRIVGVTGDVKQLSLLAENPTHTIYLPPWFMYWPTMNLVVRTASGDPAAQSAALREAVRRADPSQPVYDVRTMRGFVSTVVERPRLAAWLLGGFAVLALMLASVGVAGLVAYAVTRRRPELAIRLALGATPGRVTAEVTRAHLGVCAIGLLLGIGGAYALRPVIGALLFGVDAGDPAIFGLATGLLLAVAALACWLPARRITRIDPAVALRSE